MCRWITTVWLLTCFLLSWGTADLLWGRRGRSERGGGGNWKDSSIFLAKSIHSNKNREIPNQLFQWLARKIFPWNTATENALCMLALLKECSGAFQFSSSLSASLRSVTIVRTGFCFVLFLNSNSFKSLGSTLVLQLEILRLGVIREQREDQWGGSGKWSKDEVGLQLCWPVMYFLSCSWNPCSSCQAREKENVCM